MVGDASGLRLRVDGRDFMVFGMNWDYFPIGTNYNYSIWKQPDDFIEAALAREMPLLRAMGVNAIRVYAGIPARWVKHIYERYGIYSVVNHTVAATGTPSTASGSRRTDRLLRPALRAAVTAEVLALVDELKGTPGLLMWLLGNENNYGLSWRSTEIENLPVGERDAGRARFLYSLFGEIIRDIKARDPEHLISIANGDVQYIDIIAQECKGLDVFGANVYRGISAGDLFKVVHEKLGMPVMFTEFGSDAWNAKEMREADLDQATYLLGQWREIYEQSAGKGRVGNAVGGFTFQWSDGWWKYNQETNLDVHDTNASWANGGYRFDYVEGENNMNEEWFGICAKGPPDSRGLFDLYPRAAYYALREAFRLAALRPRHRSRRDPASFGAIEPAVLAVTSRANQASLASAISERVRLTNARLEFWTFSTGGTNISTPPKEHPQSTLPSYLGFGNMESFFVDVLVQPVQQLVATVSVNVLGSVARNPIDEIFYQARGRPREVTTADGTTLVLNDLERVQVYSASVSWDEPWFNLQAFYRTGHTSWANEGDFFVLYGDAYYGNNLAWDQRQIDIYNASAPSGFVVSGKKAVEGLKIAYGPQLWWGANPAVMLKYTRAFGPYELTFIDEEQVGLNLGLNTSSVVPQQQQRRTALSMSARWGITRLQLGVVQSGAPTIFAPNSTGKLGQHYQVAGRVASDQVSVATPSAGRPRSRSRTVLRTSTPREPTWAWWRTRDTTGRSTPSPAGPSRTRAPATRRTSSPGSHTTSAPSRSGRTSSGRSPSSVRGRATRASRPATSSTIPSPCAATARPSPASSSSPTTRPRPRGCGPGTTWRARTPTSRQPRLRLPSPADLHRRQHLHPGRRLLPGALRLRKPSRRRLGAEGPLRLGAHAGWRGRRDFGGPAQAVGPSPRLVNRYGIVARLTWQSLAFMTFLKFNDWGAYDYYKDFNLTYPMQVMGDLSYAFGIPVWLAVPQTRIGVRGTYRTLNGYSNRFVPNPSTRARWAPSGRSGPT